MHQSEARDNPPRVVPTKFGGREAFRFERERDDGKTIVTGLLVTDPAGVRFLRKELQQAHFERNNGAIAVEEATIDLAETMGAEYVVAVDMATKRVYKTTVPILRGLGWTETRGHGWQIFLRVQHWNKTEGQLAGVLHRQAPMLFPVNRGND